MNRFGRFVDLDGNPVKKDRYNYPYSYDPYVEWMDNYQKGVSHAVYSDRLQQWDSEKYKECCEEAFGSRGGTFSQKSQSEIERFLTLYFGEEVRLTAVMQGCNVSNGYPYWIFYYETKLTESGKMMVEGDRYERLEAASQRIK